ncbi:hypothetical protein [Paenibacillus lignilyticus]|uniref:Uncharacterized protein n=1 Tax=Paenibacillus lignilyticus TaxID=1172615 RepID=A0ABS5CJC8_9BACL|nr:hypothetical protein [Paenibacillus lignilyticus]MBP3965971.1 hypothetical protein [Paenibacillus lignilyticus]
MEDAGSTAEWQGNGERRWLDGRCREAVELLFAGTGFEPGSAAAVFRVNAVVAR